MIKKIVLTNFQAHVHTTIKFHPGLNVIVGESNAGKSSILRALKKVIRDLPAGNNFVNKDVDGYEIRIDVDDFCVTRHITKDKKGVTKDNQYRLECVTAKPQQFDSFGREIPHEVVVALNMPLIDLDDGTQLDLHFANQHDQPFLVEGTASTRSKVLGRISGLNIVDRAIQNVKKETRQINSTLKVVDKDTEQLKDELTELPDTNALQTQNTFFEKELENIEQKHTKLQVLQNTQEQLNVIVRQGTVLRTEVDALPDFNGLDFNNIKSKIRDYTQFKKLSNSVNTLNTQIEALEHALKATTTITIDDFTPIQTKIVKCQQLTELFNSVITFDIQITTLEKDSIFNFTIISTDIEPIQSKITQYTQLDRLTKMEDAYVYSLAQLKTQLEKLDIDCVETKQKWESLLKKLEICPTCKQSTKEVKFEQSTKNL